MTSLLPPRLGSFRAVYPDARTASGSDEEQYEK